MRRGVAARWAAWRRAGGQVVSASPLAPITFPVTPLTARVEIALGADPTADPATWNWLDITPWVRYQDGIHITRGRPDETATVNPGRARLRLDNRDGRFSRRNPTGPYYGLLSKNTPIRIGVNPGDGVHYRFHGFINEWPNRWSAGLIDTTIPIVCAGVLRRLGQTDALSSALTYQMAGLAVGDFQPHTYHPGEDESDSTQMASAIAGRPAADISGTVSFASYPGIAGSKPIPTLNNTARITAQILGYMPTTIWQLQFVAYLPTAPSSLGVYLDLRLAPTAGTLIQRILVRIDTPFTDWQVLALDKAGTTIHTATMPVNYGASHLYALSYFDNGATHVYLGEFDVNGFVQETSFHPAGTVPNLRTWIAAADSGNSGWSLGHVAVFIDPGVLSAPSITQNARALDGFTGERAHERMTRLSRIQDVPFATTAGVSAAMGPQLLGTYLDNMRACEAADMGVLYEHEFGLGYQSLDDRLNAPVALVLDFNAGHIAETPESIDDDQRLTNRVTVTRTGGSSSTVEDTVSVAAEGPYRKQVSVNVQSDSQVADVAGWQLHLGTVDEDRWPSIAVRLDASPELIPTWTALPFGARMTVANPPAEMPPDTLDLVIEGWSERLDQFTWTVDMNTGPATPYQVGVIEGEARLSPDTLSLNAAIDATQTTISILSNPTWFSGTAEFPVDVRFGGEVMTFTACVDPTSPQDVTVIRSVNGVVKAHAAGTTGELVHPLIPVP